MTVLLGANMAGTEKSKYLVISENIKSLDVLRT